MDDQYVLVLDEPDIYNQAARRGEVLVNDLNTNSHHISQVIRQIRITVSLGTTIEILPSHLAETNAWQYLMKAFTMTSL